MGCSCGGGNNTVGAQTRDYIPDTPQQKAVLVYPDGSTLVFPDRLAADAYNAQCGYCGVVQMVG